MLCTKPIMMLLNSLPQNAAEVKDTKWMFCALKQLSLRHTLGFFPFFYLSKYIFAFFIKANHLGNFFHLNILKSSLKRRIAKCCEIYFEGYSNLYKNLHMDMPMEVEKNQSFRFLTIPA